VARSVKGPACLVQHLFALTRLREPIEADGCGLREMERALKGAGGNIVALFARNVANEDLFWRRAPR
jgi:hypothetical protein